MTSEKSTRTSAAPTTPRIQRVIIIVAVVFFLLFLVYQALTYVWKHSGSNEWKLAKQEQGIQIWSLKTPGARLIKLKAQMTVEARLASIVYLLEDTETVDEDRGIKEIKVLEQHLSPDLVMAYHQYEHQLPFPIGLREFVLQTHRTQNLETKVVQINLIAAPNKVAPNKSVSRIQHLNNIWTLSPLPGGKVEVSVSVDLNFGGNLPFFVNNLALTRGFFDGFLLIQQELEKARYKNAEIAFVEELKRSG